ncbi:RNA polymerase factor sigma-32 [Balneatrix alpica]|uniref:RNA polymerase sigma factor n=1 Tax=Balneatrix alpica TaxID=75684 RepID=A0ABV5ZEI6_9GAMM|nr:RNA polymerase factor sigma-32 [Balneatrix alpica]
MGTSIFSPGRDIHHFIHKANAIKSLSKAEELELSRRSKLNDKESIEKLVLANLKSVIWIAYSYRGYGLPIADLIQEGTAGLMKALKGHDPDRNIRLSTFAAYWIRAEIHKYVIKHSRIMNVATNKEQHKLFFKLRAEFKGVSLSEAEVDDIAERLGVSREAVKEMELRLKGKDMSYVEFDEGRDDDGFDGDTVRSLESSEFSPERMFTEERSCKESSKALANALATLEPRSRDIIVSRWLTDNKMSLQELADRYDISSERVRQLEAKALKDIQKILLGH